MSLQKEIVNIRALEEQCPGKGNKVFMDHHEDTLCFLRRSDERRESSVNQSNMGRKMEAD